MSTSKLGACTVCTVHSTQYRSGNVYELESGSCVLVSGKLNGWTARTVPGSLVLYPKRVAELRRRDGLGRVSECVSE